MLNLRERPPEGIEALGFFWHVQTDFRYWIDYPDRIAKLKNDDMSGYAELFLGEVPIVCDEVLKALNDFYYIPNEIPRNSASEESFLSYDYDADYIYAAFMQSYGIDLYEPLHWHIFVALLGSLPEDTMLAKIIKYRTYEGSSKNPAHEEYMRLKQVWQLPMQLSEEEREAIDRFNSL